MILGACGSCGGPIDTAGRCRRLCHAGRPPLAVYFEMSDAARALSLSYSVQLFLPETVERARLARGRKRRRA